MSKLHFRKKYSIFLLIFLACVLPMTFGQNTQAANELLNWYKSEKTAKRYEDIKDSLLPVYELAYDQNLPLWILTARLKQGAAKRVRPNILLAAMYAEIKFISSAMLLVNHLEIFENEEQLDGKEKRRYEDLIHNITIYLRAGLTDNFIRSVFEVSISQNKNTQDSLRVCSVILSLIETIGLPETEGALLADSLLASSLSSTAYESIGSFMAKASLSRIATEEIVEMVTDTLKQRGGLIQLEQELERRRRP